MRTEIELVSARTARARMEDGVLKVRMPADWPAPYRAKAQARFERWAAKHVAAAAALPAHEPGTGREWTQADMEAYVRALNGETFGVAVRGVRLGNARRTRLAQVNTKTGVITFSRFAVNGMPDRALRYLVLHELAHLIEANHSPRFWAQVARFEPDYRRQRAIAQAHHARMAAEPAERPAALPPALVSVPPPPSRPEPESHPFGPLFAFVSSRAR